MLNKYKPDLRPGNRGIGVSVAVAHALASTGIYKLARTVIRRLAAFDAASGVSITVEPGAPIEVCRIHHNRAGAEDLDVYVMEFESAGRQLRCPLVQFQARTKINPPGNGG